MYVCLRCPIFKTFKISKNPMYYFMYNVGIYIYTSYISKLEVDCCFCPFLERKILFYHPTTLKFWYLFEKKFCQKYQNLCYTPDLIPCNIQRGKMVPSTSFQVKDEHRVFCFESNRIHSADEVDGRVTNEHQTKILNEYN